MNYGFQSAKMAVTSSLHIPISLSLSPFYCHFAQLDSVQRGEETSWALLFLKKGG